jgi:predicted DNA-binding protein
MIIRSISLDNELNHRIQEYCKNTGRTVSGLISILLIKLMEEQEDGARGSQKLFEEKD